MTELVLLRFRDLTAEISTIEAHNGIAAVTGRVLWGWWKKPPELLPDPGLRILKGDLRAGEPRVLFIDSATRKVYRAPLFDVHYTSNEEGQPPPDPEMCPEYYRPKNLPVWFEVGMIEEVPEGFAVLDGYVFSEHNRTSSRRSVTALHTEAIGQVVTDVDFLDSHVSLWFIVPTDEIGIQGRGDFVPPVSRGFWPIRGRYAIHISDLHFGSEHAYRNELAPGGGPRLGKASLLEALLQDVEDAGIGPEEIAIVFVTGDLTWRGNAHEFANATALFENLERYWGLHKSQIIAIPGNHDIEWVEDKGIDPNAELNYENFCRGYYGSKSLPSFMRISLFRVGQQRIRIIALNSCRIESRETAGLGFVGREQLRDLDRHLPRLTPKDNEIRIALIHHHLLPVNFLEHIDWETKRLSITLDAEAVIRTLMAHHVRFVLHGHQHQPYFSELRRILAGTGQRPGIEDDVLDERLVVVGGGSVGVSRGHLNVVGRNTYNIIDLLESDQSIEFRTRVQSSVGPGFHDFQRVSFGLR